jgi:hypothetical protein
MNKVNSKIAKKLFSKPALLSGESVQFKIKLAKDKKAMCGKLCMHTSK